MCYVNEKDKSQIYTGNAIKPEFSVKVGESTLVKNKDFSVKYMNNKEAGVAYAVITGKKGYVGSVVKEFEITPAKSILRLKREIKAVTYNGKLQKPKVSVMAGSKTLKAGRDYTVSYSKNLHASKVRNQKEAVVTITGKGNYRGVKSSFNFEIKPQNIKKVSVKGTSKVLNLILRILK